MTHYFLIVAVLSISFFAHTVYSAQTISTKLDYAGYLNKESREESQKLKEPRQLFIKAKNALEQKKYKYFKRLLRNEQLKNYPLAIFLEYKHLRKNLYQASDNNVRKFIEQHENTPYADKIKKKWLDILVKKRRWKTYLAFYSPQKSIRRQCNYLHALINTGKKQQAFKQVKPLWLSSKSQPKSCDPVFKSWETAGYINDDLRWQRIQLAMAKSRTSLAKYIAKSMSQLDKSLLSQWISLHRKPKKLNKSAILSASHPSAKRLATKKLQQQIILHTIKRRARKKPIYASLLLVEVQKKVSLDKKVLDQAYRAIGLSLARKHQPGGWFWLNKVADETASLYTKEWRVRAAIREQNAQAIIGSIKRLPIEEQQTQRWQFWFAQATENLGDKKSAEVIYKKLALKRGYYAFLAADKTGQTYELNDTPIVYNDKDFTQVKENSGIQRAYEFLILGMKIEARREWYFATKHQFSKQQNIMAAKLAQSWGWHDRAIITIANTGEYNDINLRFPLMLEDAVAKYSKINQLDAAYTYAVIRRESAFSIEARSPVGAMGLMQIMPATGKQVARKLKLPYKNKIQLYSSDFNLKLGTNYLRAMLEKFYQQPVLASAAYNAGGHRVKKWLPKNKALDASVWVETIPFQETRAYVSAILAYTAIYQHRLSQPFTRLTQRMPDVPFKE